MLKWYINLSLFLKLGVILLAFGILGAINFISISFFQQKQKSDTAVVDAAGRQRMLSQRIAFYAERFYYGDVDIRQNLESTLVLCDSSLSSLKNGGVAPGIANDIELPRTPQSLLPVLQKAEEVWSKYQSRTQILLDNSSTQAERDRSIEYIEQNAANVLTEFNLLVKAYVGQNQSKQDQLNTLLLLLLITNCIFVALGFLAVSKYIRQPITEILNHVDLLSLGETGKHNYTYESEDEIGVAVNSLKKLDSAMLDVAEFAQNVGNGNLNSSLSLASDNDVLGNALINMRDKLIANNTSESERRWAAEGLAKFSEILQIDTQNTELFYNEIIANLVKFLKIVQGGIFLINNDNPEEEFIELKAAYAYERKKFLKKRIEKGQGLLGQAILEKQSIYTKELPNNYVNITSGLGHANPNILLIVPLIHNHIVYGALELASFTEFSVNEIEFIEKLSESIAATVSSVKIAHQTSMLLEQSKIQTTELEVQKEEMRQNMEELQATQEEMERKEKEYLEKIKWLEKQNVENYTN